MGAAGAIGSLPEGLISALATGILVGALTLVFVVLRNRYERKPSGRQDEALSQTVWKLDQFELLWLGLLGVGTVTFGIVLAIRGGFSGATVVLWPLLLILAVWIALRLASRRRQRE
jgi:hypothetical protein